MIEVPETISTKVLQEGTMDYRPQVGSDVKPVIKPVNPSYSSFFKSGKSLNKHTKEFLSVTFKKQKVP